MVVPGHLRSQQPGPVSVLGAPGAPT